MDSAATLPLFNPERATAHLAAIVESSEDAIVSKTLDGIILTWNVGAEHVYGYSASEAIGQPMTLLLPRERWEEEAEILRRIQHGDRVEHFETIRRRKNGELITVSLTISPIRDHAGRIIAASHIARNITDRKSLEEQLHRLASIVECSQDAIISKTLTGHILTWNTGAEHVYGYLAAEAIGQPMTLLLPPDRSNEETEILNRIRRGEPVEHFETVRRKKNGELIHVSLTISPIRDESGRITAASHVARDITERKRLEEQLRQTQKLESLGVLAGGIAHDFNNLLTGILGSASLALETVSTNNPARGLMDEVIRASERAAHLTRQLLAYAGKGQYVIEPVDLSELVVELSDLIRTSIPRNVELKLELRDDLPRVLADSSQLQQLVMNLIINGAEAIATDRTGVVTVTTGTQSVDEDCLRGAIDSSSELTTGTCVSIEVHDTGCGMDEDTLARIFDPFFTTKFTGRGLGLAAVQGIVRAHKGAIKVNSNPGEGTTFRVTFPATEQPAPAEPAPAAAPASRASELILVVDDEEVIRRTAKAVLERHGYTVVVAENGKEGLDLFQVLAEKVSAVLLDLTMPVLNGEEAFRRMRAIKPGAKVILSSGYSEVDAVRRFAGEGLAGFLQKPYSAPSLLEKLKFVLEESEEGSRRSAT